MNNCTDNDKTSISQNGKQPQSPNKNKTWILNKTGKIGIYNILLVAEKMQQEKEKRNENHKFLQHYLYASPENNIHKLT